MKPILSIIIPVYNVEDYLERCLNSFINQQGNFEIITVDDGSKDSSGLILDQYAIKDDRIKVFHKQNGGVSCARNFGIKKAKAENIAFFDSDDFVSERYFSTIVELLKYGADLTCFNQFRQDGEKKAYMAKKFAVADGYYTNIVDFYKYCFDYYNYFDAPHNKIYKKSIIKKYDLHFREDIKVSEDKIFNLDYMQVINSIYISSDTLYYYFYNPGGALRKRKLSYLMDYEKVFDKKINLIKKLNIKYDEEKLYLTFLDKIFMNYDNFKLQGISDDEIKEQLLKGNLYKKLLRHTYKGKIAKQQQKRLKAFSEGKFLKFKFETFKFEQMKKIADKIKKKKS